MTIPQRLDAGMGNGAVNRLAPMILLSAIGYNALLALFNAHLFQVNLAIVALTEIVILAAAILCSLNVGLSRYTVASLLFMAPFIFIALVISLVNEAIYPDALRNIMIISSFTALGYSISERSLRTSVLLVTIVVTMFLILEISYLQGYAAVFQPAKYLEATRGYDPFEFNDTGLFAGALGYNERFNYGIFKGPRTSSIFLEQVSMAGFAAVLSIYLLGDWPQLGGSRRIFYVLLVVAILVTNNTRATSALVILFLFGYIVFPKLPPRLTYFIAPVVLMLSFILVGQLRPGGGTSDDLIGRLAITVNDLKEQTAGTLLLGSISAARKAVDSGYVYILTSSTFVGLLLFWGYLNVMPALDTDDQRRVRWALGIYVWAWLLIGGTAIFSMKTSSLLWLTVGNLAARGTPSPRPGREGPSRPALDRKRTRLTTGLV